MHRAPSVNYSVGRSRWQAWCIGCLSLVALASWVVFVRDQVALDARSGAMAVALLVASTTALLGWKRSPKGNLRWDGEHWYWSGFAENPLCRLHLAMDFQRLVIVTIQPEAQPSICLWLEATPGDASWKPLRRAIVSGRAVSNGKGKRPEADVLGEPT